MQVTCPSGLVLELRKWRFGDRVHLSDMSLRKSGKLPLRMLEIVTEGVVNPGPYKDLTDHRGKLDPRKLSMMDLLGALFAARVERKPELGFSSPCGGCGRLMSLEVDLRDCDTEEIPEAGLTHLATGEPIEVRLPLEDPDENPDAPKATVKFRLLMADDFIKLGKHRDQGGESAMMEAQLLMPISALHPPNPRNPDDPAPGAPLTSYEEIRDFVRNCDDYFVQELAREYLEASGNVELAIKITCEHCMMEQYVIVPFTEPFFFPTKSRSPFSSVTP